MHIQTRLQPRMLSMARLGALPVVWVAGVAAALVPAAQRPVRAQVIPAAGGAGTTVNASGGQFDIAGGTQASGNLFHEFDQFDLSAGETANFVGNSEVFNIVGHISQANPSYIDGTVQVSGSDADLYLVNPAGILFGPDAQLSLQGSFTATTADQVGFGSQWLDVTSSTSDYSGLSGDPSGYRFTGSDASAVVNYGDLAVAPGESIALVGGNVVNTGSLAAPSGEIGLAAVEGNSAVRLSAPGSLLSFEVTEESLLARRAFAPTDLPTLLTGGAVPLPDSLTVRSDGSVRLSGFGVGAEEVAVAGRVSTRGEDAFGSAFADGGTISLLGRSVDVASAVVDASGQNGGTVTVGSISDVPMSQETKVAWLAQGSEIRADGLAGAGGEIQIVANTRARVRSTVSATGTTDGGTLLTSAERIDFADLSLSLAGGDEGGHWLVEQSHIDIAEGNSPFNQIDPDLIEGVLDVGTAVSLSTSFDGSGDIALLTGIDQTGGGSASLTFTGRRFEDNGHEVSLSSAGQLTFDLNVVNPEAVASSSSIESAIAAIGDVNGRRLINLGAGDYDFTTAVNIDTDVDIEGASADSTSLRTTLANNRVFEIERDVDVAIRDVTLTTSALASHDSGGGIRNSGALTIENSTFAGNSSARNGGAIEGDADSVLVIVDSLFEGNSAANRGGAVYTTGAAAVSRSDFEKNQASDGGAIALEVAGALMLTDTVLTSNQVAEDGGGLYLSDRATASIFGTLTTTDSGEAILASTRFEDNTAADDGGGIAAFGEASVRSSGALFRGNESGDDGGGVALTFTSSATLTNSNFEHNYAAEDGGGIYSSNTGGSVTTGDKLVLTGSRLIANEAGNSGGGLSQSREGNALVQGSLFRANQAAVDGGGIHVSASGLTLERSQLMANEARFGAGMEVSLDGVVTVTDTAFTGNQSSFMGGGLQVDTGSQAAIARSLFEGNQAVNGGGLFNFGTTDIVNTTFSGNIAKDHGGAIRSFDAAASLSLLNSTLTDNEASTYGGGIAESGTQLARLQNTIVAVNNAPTAEDLSGAFTDEGNNLIGVVDGATGLTADSLQGTAASPLDPRLAALADNGGPTKTHFLLSGSVAIDSGSTLAPVVSDQRGAVRFAGRALDIGAVELSAAELAVIAPTSPTDNLPAGLVPADLSSLDPSLDPGQSGAALADDLETVLATRNTHNLSAANLVIRRLEAMFGQSFEDYWHLSSTPELSFEEVQAILRRAQAEYKVNSAVVYARFSPPEPVEATPQTLLFVEPEASDDDLLNLSIVLPEGELVSYELPVTRREANRQVRLLRSMVSDPVDPTGHQPLTQQLYQWLLAPLEEDLAAQNIHNLMYALDEGLRTVPVAAMRDEQGYSLERYGISVVPSVGLMQADFPVRVRRATVAMGVSEFESDHPLPAVPVELASVKNIVPVANTLLNEGSTLSALESIHALEQPGILHLATHANFDNRSPESSYIQLWNEPLSMQAFSDLGWERSDLELLILSACSTALSGRNSELGFAGLAAAAGVDASMGSLWQVSDVGTLALMSEFYAQLESTDLRFEALRYAQLALLRGETRIEGGNLVNSHGEVALPAEWNLPDSATLDHPFFWSAFTMIGNPW